MTVRTTEIELSSSGDLHAIDITDRLLDFVGSTGLSEGVLTVFTRDTACAVSAMEFEPGILEDMAHLFERLSPTRDTYRHNQRCLANDGHACMRALLTGASVSIPIREGRPILGQRQQVMFIDFGPGHATRHVIFQVLGE